MNEYVLSTLRLYFLFVLSSQIVCPFYHRHTCKKFIDDINKVFLSCVVFERKREKSEELLGCADRSGVQTHVVFFSSLASVGGTICLLARDHYFTRPWREMLIRKRQCNFLFNRNKYTAAVSPSDFYNYLFSNKCGPSGFYIPWRVELLLSSFSFFHSFFFSFFFSFLSTAAAFNVNRFQQAWSLWNWLGRGVFFGEQFGAFLCETGCSVHVHQSIHPTLTRPRVSFSREACLYAGADWQSSYVSQRVARCL